MNTAYAEGQEGCCACARRLCWGGGACEDDEDKDEDVEDEGGAAHAHVDCVWVCL
jgi:hypothetical protein